MYVLITILHAYMYVQCLTDDFSVSIFLANPKNIVIFL
jgi:hypothetical protein